MKRSALVRKSGLNQGTKGLKRGDSALKRTRIAPVSAKRAAAGPSPADIAGREAWAAATAADPRCACCGRGGRMHGHHVVLARHVRKHGGDVWDLRNRLSVAPACHLAHHESSGRHRIALSVLRPENVQFAVGLLGEEAAREYLDRHYASLAIASVEA